jgi:5-methylcytosine-specific restriction protein B
MKISRENTMENELNKIYKDYCESGRIEFITFHPAYSYEEFIEGITVETEDEGHSSDKIQYTLKAGIFKELCKRALASAMNLDQDDIEDKSWKNIYHEYCENKDPVDFDSAPKFVLIIDEINRGDIAKIFGELITLIEADKRIGAENELIVKLPVSGDPFGVPMNVYIIGTMNTADRSIALVDVALRRRFGFIEMNPDFNILREEHLRKKESSLKENGVYDLLERSISAIESINVKISDDPSIGRDKQIGHSFLFKVETANDLIMVWRYEIFPLLEEYCYSDYKKINKIVFNRDDNTEWITESGGIQPIDENNIGDMLGSVK